MPGALPRIRRVRLITAFPAWPNRRRELKETVGDALAREFGGSPGQERNEVITNPVIRFVMDDFRPVPWAINIDNHAFSDSRKRAISHKQYPIRQQDCFVYIMGNHEDGLLGGRLDADQFILDAATCKRIKRAKGFIEQQKLRLDGECSRDRYALTHTA
jgi:hypothetical protein